MIHIWTGAEKCRFLSFDNKLIFNYLFDILFLSFVIWEQMVFKITFDFFLINQICNLNNGNSHHYCACLVEWSFCHV